MTDRILVNRKDVRDVIEGIDRPGAAGADEAAERLRVALDDELGHIQVGDPDPTGNALRVCEDNHHGVLCTRGENHPGGLHIAGDGEHVVAVWHDQDSHDRHDYPEPADDARIWVAADWDDDRIRTIPLDTRGEVQHWIDGQFDDVDARPVVITVADYRARSHYDHEGALRAAAARFQEDQQ